MVPTTSSTAVARTAQKGSVQGAWHSCEADSRHGALQAGLRHVDMGIAHTIRLGSVQGPWQS